MRVWPTEERAVAVELVYPDALGRIFALVCGQDPAHTWMPGGMALACCQRCLGLYVGAAAAVLLHGTLRPKMSGRFLEVHGVFLALMIPLGFHWLEQGPVLRTVSGLIFGFGVATFLWLPFAREKARGGIAEGTRVRIYWLSMAVAALMLPLLAPNGGLVAAGVLSIIALSGLLALAVLCIALLLVGVISGIHLINGRSGQRGSHPNSTSVTAPGR